jgi:hypothetical protein
VKALRDEAPGFVMSPRLRGAPERTGWERHQESVDVPAQMDSVVFVDIPESGAAAQERASKCGFELSSEAKVGQRPSPRRALELPQ